MARVRVASLDSITGPRIEATLSEAIRRAGRSLRGVVLDLGDVDFMNSTGLAVCIDAAKQARDRGFAVATCGLRSDVAKIFELMKVDRLIPPHPDTKAAIAGVRA